MIGEEEAIGRGYGRRMLLLLTEITFRDTPAERIILQPDVLNYPSRNTAKSCGYRHVEPDDYFILTRKDYQNAKETS